RIVHMLSDEIRKHGTALGAFGVSARGHGRPDPESDRGGHDSVSRYPGAAFSLEPELQAELYALHPEVALVSKEWRAGGTGGRRRGRDQVRVDVEVDLVPGPPKVVQQEEIVAGSQAYMLGHLVADIQSELRDDREGIGTVVSDVAGESEESA